MSASQKTQIVTRFAPSPTGFLHIGGARTALFNWAFARHNSGKFLLRIEDTDRARSSEEAISAILKGLEWLGIDYDDSPIYQHQNLARHAEIAHQLLTQGKAYKCTCTREQLDAMREEAIKNNQPIRYNGHCRDIDPNTISPDTDHVIRFRAPQSGNTEIDDKVQGLVSIQNNQLDDLILLRSDGTPTYMLSVVVDDYDMGVTHIIRGDDHLTNAARQQQIYEALGWTPPVFAHIPLIHGPDGAKLSKRHGALGVEAYADMGYLPEAMRNYLARLGWSHGDDELFSTAQFIDWFNLEAIGKSPARFDFDKLAHVNTHHLRQMADAELLDLLLAQNPALKDHQDAIRRALPLIKEKANSLDEIATQCAFLWASLPLQIDEKLQKALDDERKSLLVALANIFAQLAQWDKPTLETCIGDFMASHDIKMGQIGPALRACLTGTTQSPAIYDVLFLLGQDETIKRIRTETG
ncbi:MAG: glutamate--tRNA ligase [Parvibaculales bacterium]